jgi:hypothetical protein
MPEYHKTQRRDVTEKKRNRGQEHAGKRYQDHLQVPQSAKGRNWPVCGTVGCTVIGQWQQKDCQCANDRQHREFANCATAHAVEYPTGKNGQQGFVAEMGYNSVPAT